MISYIHREESHARMSYPELEQARQKVKDSVEGWVG